MDLNKTSRRKEMAKRIRPLLVLILLVPIVTFMMYPMMNMAPKDLNVGIVNLDRGAEFDQGKVNLGDKIIKNITKPDEDNAASAEESPVIWQSFSSEKEVEEALKDEEIYAYLVIPKDFSSAQTQQLTAFNGLSAALGNMSEGTGKMAKGIGQASGRLTQLPLAFNGLAEASSGLSAAAQGGKEILDNTSNAININADNIVRNDEAVNGQLAEISDKLSALEAKVADGSITTEDVEAIQALLDSVNANNTESVNAIKGSSAALTGEGQSAAAIFGKIAAAEAQMSSNFSDMANNMSGVSNISQLGNALGMLSSGLSQMAGGMDEKVSDAIHAMNGDEEATESKPVKLQFYIDQSRNVMISTTMTQMMNGVSANAGIQIDTHYLNSIPDELNNFYFAMVFMMMIMFASMIPGILTGLTLKPQGERTDRLKTLAIQILLAATIALCLGFTIPRIIAWMGGYTLPLNSLTPFVAVCAFGMLMIIAGAIDCFGRGGIAVPAVIMFCGTAVANLPYEYLPAFWQKFIYPWESLRFIADGVREIIYRGGDWWNQNTINMSWLVVIGLVLMLISLLRRSKDLSKDSNEGESHAVLG